MNLITLCRLGLGLLLRQNIHLQILKTNTFRHVCSVDMHGMGTHNIDVNLLKDLSQASGSTY